MTGDRFDAKAREIIEAGAVDGDRFGTMRAAIATALRAEAARAEKMLTEYLRKAAQLVLDQTDTAFDVCHCSGSELAKAILALRESEPGEKDAANK